MKLNLTKDEVDNFTYNPDFTFLVGSRDYMEELLFDWLIQNAELGVRAKLIEQLEKALEIAHTAYGLNIDDTRISTALSTVKEWRKK